MSGEDVKKILGANGITQRELASRLGMSPQNLGSQLGKDAGHRTTAIYIKRDQRKVDEANRLVIDYIKGNRPASHDAGRERN